MSFIIEIFHDEHAHLNARHQSTIASNGMPIPSTPRKYHGTIAITPISQKAANSASAGNTPAALPTTVKAIGARKAPMRPTATDRPIPVERRWVGNISENVG